MASLIFVCNAGNRANKGCVSSVLFTDFLKLLVLVIRDVLIMPLPVSMAFQLGPCLTLLYFSNKNGLHACWENSICAYEDAWN